MADLASIVPGWTAAKMKSFIISALRGSFRRFPPKQQCINDAYIETKINEYTGRMAKHYECDECKGSFPRTMVEADHIISIVDPSTGFIDWNTWIERAFVPVEGFRCLCKPCHKLLTTASNKSIREISNYRKLYPREEKVYQGMIQRCYNPKSTGYEYYGGRGIQVCESWRADFINFYNDMGVRPDGHTLDRMDVNGNYTKENCRWATHIEQARNTTANNYIEYQGDILCLEEWGEKLNIKPNTILYRLRRGWPVEEALGYIKRNKPIYNGRLNTEDIEQLIEAIDSGETQVSYGRKIGMDSSQVSRIYNKFKTSEERRKKK